MRGPEEAAERPSILFTILQSFRLLLSSRHLNMTARDSLLLSPWQKWKRFNRFPIKACLTFLIVFLVALQVNLVVEEFTDYERGTRSVLSTLFLGDAKDGIYSVDDVVTFVKNVANTYYNLNSTTVSRFVYEYEDVGNGRGSGRVKRIKPIQLKVLYYINDFYDPQTQDFDYSSFDNVTTVEEKYELQSAEDVGPFAVQPPDLQYFMYTLIRCEFVFNLKNLDLEGLLGPMSFKWKVKIITEMKESGGKVDVSVELTKGVDKDTNTSPFNSLFLLNVLLLLLSLCSVLLSLKALHRSYRIYAHVRQKFEYRTATLKSFALLEHFPKWEAIPISVKLQFFNFWTVFSLIGNSLIICSSVLGLTTYGYGWDNEDVFHLFLGFGAWFSSIALVGFLEYYQQFYTLILTLKMSFLRVLRFMISSYPIYFGYALFGLSVFSNYSPNFSSLIVAHQTLFALLNGDSILGIFQELDVVFPYPWIAKIYLFTFLLFFITAVLNIFIFIIEDAYHAAKTWGLRDGDEQMGEDFDVQKLFELLDSYKVVKREQFGKQTGADNTTHTSTTSSSSSSSSTPKTAEEKRKEETERLLEKALLQGSDAEDEEGEEGGEELTDLEELTRRSEGMSELQRPEVKRLIGELQFLFEKNQKEFISSVEKEWKKLSAIQLRHSNNLRADLKHLLSRVVLE